MPVTATLVEPGYVRQRAVALVKDGKDARVLVISAAPHWNGDATLEIEGRTVHVRPGVSQLAILNAYASLPEDDYLVVLTDRSAQDLGDTVLLRAWRRQLEQPDLWSAVPPLFKARGVARDLHRSGTWVPAALLSRTPAGGWPPTLGPEVNADFALGNLIAHLLGLPLPETIDADRVLTMTDDAAGRSNWRGVDQALRTRLEAWADEHLGTAVGFALRAAGGSSAVTPLAVGLVIDALTDPRTPQLATGTPTAREVARGQALVRLFERHLAGRQLSTAQARTIGSASRAVVGRLLPNDRERAHNVLAQAEALLSDLGWPEGAEESDLLPTGLEARLRQLGSDLARDATHGEEGLRRLMAHALARPDDLRITTARMAVRLLRWLASDEQPAVGFSEALSQQVGDGSWVDRATAAIWNGSDDPELAQTYRTLHAQVAERRRARDRLAAPMLARHAQGGSTLTHAIGVEEMLAQVVKPWSHGLGVALVVLDGMSMAVATEVAEAATAETGMVEWTPEGARRLCAVTALPSLTEISRASLFHGMPTRGNGAAEKRGLAQAMPGAVLFHKDDLRADAGAQLPDAVVSALADPEKHAVVGVVINTIDDTLHKQDPTSMRWTLDRLAPLRAILHAAADAGRTVVLTSDHGHVVERDSELRSVPGAAARWRPVSTDPVEDDEVRVAGPRVVADGNEAVLVWREGRRLAQRNAGYHGGASLAEITIPVVVLRRGLDIRQATPTGWKPATAQAPEWWNEALRSVSTAASANPPPSLRKPRSAPILPAEDALFALEPEPATGAVDAPAPDLVGLVLASPVYAAQRQRAGRRSVPDATVEAVVRALLARGGRAHRDTLAAAAGVPAATVDQTVAAIKRLLNVEGYAVLELDGDAVTVKLDEALLSDQFEVKA